MTADFPEGGTDYSQIVRDVAADVHVSRDSVARIIDHLLGARVDRKDRRSRPSYAEIVDSSVREMREQRTQFLREIGNDFVPPRFPPHVQIQTIAGCNASCIMCAMSSPAIRKIQKGSLDPALFEALIAECAANAECEEIALYLQNEPLLDRDLTRKIKLVKELSENRLRVRIVTNGSLLNESRATDLLEAGIDSIGISLNAFTPQTYSRVMRGLDYSLTLRNVETLISLAPPSVLISLTFVVIRGNEGEIREAVKYWTDRGILCGAYGVNSQGGAVEGFENLRPLNSSLRPKECYLPLESIGVLANGEFILCCADWKRESLRRPKPSGRMISEVWHSPEVAAFRRDAIRGKFAHPMCRNCLGQTRVRENLLYSQASP